MFENIYPKNRFLRGASVGLSLMIYFTLRELSGIAPAFSTRTENMEARTAILLFCVIGISFSVGMLLAWCEHQTNLVALKAGESAQIIRRTAAIGFVALFFAAASVYWTVAMTPK